MTDTKPAPADFDRCPYCNQVLVTDSCIDCPYTRRYRDPLPELADLDTLYTLAQQLSFSDHALTADAGHKLMELADKRMTRIEKEIGFK